MVWYYRILCAFTFSCSYFIYSETGKHILLFIYLGTGDYVCHLSWKELCLLKYLNSTFAKDKYVCASSEQPSTSQLQLKARGDGFAFQLCSLHLKENTSSKRTENKCSWQGAGAGISVPSGEQHCRSSIAAEVSCQLWLSPVVGDPSACLPLTAGAAQSDWDKLNARGFDDCKRETHAEVSFFSPAFHPDHAFCFKAAGIWWVICFQMFDSMSFPSVKRI